MKDHTSGVKKVQNSKHFFFSLCTLKFFFQAIIFILLHFDCAGPAKMQKKCKKMYQKTNMKNKKNKKNLRLVHLKKHLFFLPGPLRSILKTVREDWKFLLKNLGDYFGKNSFVFNVGLSDSWSVVSVFDCRKNVVLYYKTSKNMINQVV